MNDLLIGGFTDYDWNKIKVWVKSADEVCKPNVDKVMIVGRTTQDTIDQLKARNWNLIPMSEGQVHVARFLSIYDYIKDRYKQYRYVVTTDVRDVVFQADPFQYLKEDLDDKHLICGSECLKYKDEPWGNQNLYETYGEFIWNLYKDTEIYNVGVLGGTSEYMKDLVLNIAINSSNRPIKIVDQAVFNMLMSTQPYIDCTQFMRMENAWACHAGTVADPTKIDYFRPNLLEPEPVWRDGKVYTWNGALVTILHQYDRVPEWRRVIEEKYA